MSRYNVSKQQFSELTGRHTVVPVASEVVADLETPVSAYMKLALAGAGDSESSFLLESVEQGERWGRHSFIGLDPFLVMTASGGELSLQPSGPLPQGLIERAMDQLPLDAMRTLIEGMSAPALEGLPPLFAGAVGYLGYDLVRYLEKLPQTTLADVKTPELMLIFPRTIFAFDHLRQRITVVSNVLRGEDYDQSISRTEELVQKLGRPLTYTPVRPIPVDPELPPSSMTREQFINSVARAKEYIMAGDIFQVVLSHRMSTAPHADPFQTYRMLRLVNPSPYMFYLRHPDITVLGSSPEPLVKVQGKRVVQRPIAGTRPRGADEEEDRRIEEEFLSDEKERAEHIMLVDLARNDLGRVSRPGTVRVEELMQMERYSHVMHLVSQVTGELAEDCSALDALFASFPAGTVSGAPKIRAMEIIDELEPTRRGPYAGVVGYFDLSGNLDTCIALRTAYIVDGNIHVQAGAGIVADSEPLTEWNETLNKARALLTAVAMANQD